METIKMGKGVLIPTYGCNQKCVCCYAASEIDSPTSMSLKEIEKSIDFMEALGISTFTVLGGEPLISKEIFHLVKYASSKGIGAWIVTNGILLENAEFGNALVKAGLKGGCISIFSMEEAEHDAITRVKGSYKKVTKAIENAIKYNWSWYPIITIVKNNISTILRDINRLIDLGCKTIYINYGVPNVMTENDNEFDLHPEDLAKITEKLFKMQDDIGVKFIFNCEKNKIPLCHFHKDILKEMMECNQIGTGCELVKGNTIVIEPGGSVLGCSHWVGHQLMNIYKNYEELELLSPSEFWDIWMNGYPKQFRDKRLCFPYDKCAECEYRLNGMCFGGCKTWHKSGCLSQRYNFSR